MNSNEFELLNKLFFPKVEKINMYLFTKRPEMVIF